MELFRDGFVHHGVAEHPTVLSHGEAVALISHVVEDLPSVNQLLAIVQIHIIHKSERDNESCKDNIVDNLVGSDASERCDLVGVVKKPQAGVGDRGD